MIKIDHQLHIVVALLVLTILDISFLVNFVSYPFFFETNETEIHCKTQIQQDQPLVAWPA